MSTSGLKQRILNIEVDNLSLQSLLERFDHGVLVTPNVDHLITLQSNAKFHAVYSKADFVTVDSQIVFWALKLLGRGVQAKISGSDFLPAFCDYHARRLIENKPALTVYLLGSREGVADAARININRRTSSNVVLGAHSPSMTFVEDERECELVIKKINHSGASALVVGLGAPKQELWIDKYRAKMPGVKVFLAVGASIDFEAQIVERAPSWMSKCGFEWLFRLYKEPNRLWHRYLVRDPQFFWLLFLDGLRLYKDPFRNRAS
jgi:N-acetylglucosaminyldiphosphoundecaprenol N-acetyl-beta-D-mannosaminyltransferase